MVYTTIGIWYLYMYKSNSVIPHYIHIYCFSESFPYRLVKSVAIDPYTIDPVNINSIFNANDLQA